jgi:hypothetical protein
MMFLLPAGDYFKIVQSAYEKGKGASCSNEVFEGKSKFHILCTIDEKLEKEFSLLTQDFSLNLNMELNISCIDDDCGTWTKDFYCTETTECDYEGKESVGNQFIYDWFSKNIEDFI